MYYMDSTYILVILGFILSMIASFGVKSTFARYDSVKNSRGMTGAQAARKILDQNGLYNIQIGHIKGNLTDHYSPNEGIIRLSDSTYNSDSVAAIGVAAHECGHAIQYQKDYMPIKMRNNLVPIVNIGSSVSMPLFFIGLFMGLRPLALAGVILFSLVLVFQLITLPVEFDASRRALKTLESSSMLVDDEIKGARKTLVAAALTYVASVLATALQVLRLLLILNRNRRD